MLSFSNKREKSVLRTQMSDSETFRIVPVGCSCINRFQLQHAFPSRKHGTGLFDWNICAPATTIAVLDMEASGALRQRLADPDRYGLDRGIGHLVHADLPGLYFWHEDRTAAASIAGRQSLASKISHLAATFFDSNVPTHFIWSNVQPNLKGAIERGTGLPWSAFILTADVCNTLQEKLAKRFPDATVSFITRREDCDDVIADHPDVHVMELPRGQDYEGAPQLFMPVFSAINMRHHCKQDSSVAQGASNGFAGTQGSG